MNSPVTGWKNQYRGHAFVISKESSDFVVWQSSQDKYPIYRETMTFAKLKQYLQKTFLIPLLEHPFNLPFDAFVWQKVISCKKDETGTIVMNYVLMPKQNTNIEYWHVGNLVAGLCAVFVFVPLLKNM